MHLFFGTSTHSPWTADNLFFGSIWLSFLGVNLSVANMVKLVTSFSSQGSIWQNLYQTLRYFNNCSGSFSGHFECLISLSLLKKKSYILPDTDLACQMLPKKYFFRAVTAKFCGTKYHISIC